MNATNIFASKDGIGQAKWAVIVATVISALCFVVPLLNPLSYPFLLLSTLVHEMGHGVAAAIVGGQFISFKMWLNGSGVANTAGEFGPFARAFIAGAGLVGPAIVAGVSFFFIKSPRRSRFFLALFGLTMSIALILVVRNIFGALFVGLLCGLCYLFSVGPFKTYAQTMLAFLAMQLTLSVFSRSDYLFMDVAQTSIGAMPSDVAQMAEALWLPYWFWGGICGIFSLLILGFGIRQLFK